MINKKAEREVTSNITRGIVFVFILVLILFGALYLALSEGALARIKTILPSFLIPNQTSEEIQMFRYSITQDKVEYYDGKTWYAFDNKGSVERGDKYISYNIIKKEIKEHYYDNRNLPATISLADKKHSKLSWDYASDLTIYDFSRNNKDGINLDYKYIYHGYPEKETSTLRVSGLNELFVFGSNYDEVEVGETFSGITPWTTAGVQIKTYKEESIEELLTQDIKKHLNTLDEVFLPNPEVFLFPNEILPDKIDFIKPPAEGFDYPDEVKKYTLIKITSKGEEFYRVYYSEKPTEIYLYKSKTDYPETKLKVRMPSVFVPFKSEDWEEPENEIIRRVDIWRESILNIPIEITYTSASELKITGPPKTKKISVCMEKIDTYLVVDLAEPKTAC